MHRSYSTLPSDPRYLFCCNRFNVHKATPIIAALGLMMSGLMFTANLLFTVYIVVPSVISIFVYIVLIIGHVRRISVLYPVVIFVNILALISTFLIGILYVIFASLSIYGEHYHVPRAQGPWIAISFAVALLHLSFCAIQFWFCYIIYKAYKYVKEILRPPQYQEKVVYYGFQ
ncbi:hypothetical protein M3Y98_01003600 [Aphelenchoides besseyi]|nr:hypothetical protein M3Y98_01003600 [Aphelenchoides besseyi]